MNLTGKTALITGASKGIGRAIAVAYGKAGIGVAPSYLNDHAAANAVAAEIIAAGGRTGTGAYLTPLAATSFMGEISTGTAKCAGTVARIWAAAAAFRCASRPAASTKTSAI